MNSPAGTQFTYTGDTFDATITYDGYTLTLNMFDVTAGGSCPGASCFTQAWTGVYIPSIVGGTTAWVGFTAGTSGGGTASTTNLLIKTFTYTVNTPTGSPSYTAYNANSTYNTGVSSAASPVFSVAPGSYSGTQSVSITTSTSPNNYICYTLSATPLTPASTTLYPHPDNNGGCSAGTLYTGAVSIASTSTLYAMAGSNNSAFATGLLSPTGLGPPSTLVAGTYTIGAGAVPTCTLAPNYQSVTNLPGFGFTAMAGQVITPNVIQSGCRSFSITNLGVASGVISATGSGFTFNVGDLMVITTQNSFPYQQLSNTVAQIATATATTFTTQPISSLINIAPGAVTMTAIQVSPINYSLATTTGSITGTLSCTTNCSSAVTLTIGSTPANGNCTFTGSGPTYTGVTSTQSLTITATAPGSGSTTTIPVYVCSAPILPQIAGDLYYQNYVGQQRHLASFVWGTTNQQVTWSKTGPCTLSNTTGSREVVVTTTGIGYCAVTVTSVADVTKSQTATIYIPAALPVYGDVTPVTTEALPCAIDANLTGNVFTVGAGKTYSTIGAVPWNNNSLMIPGSTVQIFNTAAGTGQSTYTEGWQIVYGGIAGQPIHVYGVPNTAGYPPIIEASSAVFPSWTSTFAAGFGVINLQTNNGSLGISCNGFYPSPSCGPNYILINGLQIQNAVGPNTWSITGGGSGTWGSGADGINVRQGSYITLDSNLIINSEQGVGTYNNANNGWAGMTQMVDVSRPVCSQCGGRSGDSTSHPAYLQSYGMFYHEFIIGNAPTGDSGSCIKDRNIGSIIVGGYCGTGYSRYFDRVEDQDSFQYVDGEFLRSGRLSGVR